MEFTRVSYEEIISRVSNARESGERLRVVTPNIFHLHLAEKQADFASIVNSAELVVPDGWPVVASLKRADPDYSWRRIAGSDLTVDVLAAASRAGLSVAFFGGSDEVVAAAADAVAASYPECEVIRFAENLFVSAHPTAGEVDDFVRIVSASSPDVLFLCMGAPKSERLLAHAWPRLGGVRVALCVGAAVDFVAGTKARAPKFVQRMHLEWAFRLLQEPRRLASRYWQSFHSWRRVHYAARREARRVA